MVAAQLVAAQLRNCRFHWIDAVAHGTKTPALQTILAHASDAGILGAPEDRPSSPLRRFEKNVWIKPQ